MRVLFLGNSHTFFNDMPTIFQYLMKEGTGEDVEVTMQAHPGVTFGWHLSQGAELRYALMHGNYDYLVMQQAAHVPAPAPEETITDGKKIIELAKSCGVKPILCMPWAEKRFPEHQATMFNTYTRLSEETGVSCDVTGYVFNQIGKEYPEINLYFVDGEHCNAYGSYVRALSAYAAITGKSPVGLPARSIQSYTVDEKAAIAFQTIQSDLDKDPENPSYQLIAKAFWSSVKSKWDKEDLWQNLNPDTAKLLQELVAKHANLL